MTRDFSVIIERDAEGYYVGTVPTLRGCHSQARSLDELMDRIREAIEVCLEAQGDSLEPLICRHTNNQRGVMTRLP